MMRGNSEYKMRIMLLFLCNRILRFYVILKYTIEYWMIIKYSWFHQVFFILQNIWTKNFCRLLFAPVIIFKSIFTENM